MVTNQLRTQEWDLSHFQPNTKKRLSIDPRKLKSTPENQLIYDGFGTGNQDDLELVQSIESNGVLEPIRISKDGFILSGHRRTAAAIEAGRDRVPYIVEPIAVGELSRRERLEVLRKFNLQREKSPNERIREAMVDVDPEEAYRNLRKYRIESQQVHCEHSITLGAVKGRSKITTLKFLDAAQRVVEASREYWPLTVRRVHYLLLNDPPLRHDAKPDSTYQNDKASYKALTNLLLRARLEGEIPMAAIEDETRPITCWNTFQNPAQFISQKSRAIFRGYARDLMQGQQNHVEILLEKNALRKVIERVASDYTIPVTTGRGYSSLSPRHSMVTRFINSGRTKLVLLVLTDFDPDGEMIASSFPRSLRDDFGLENITAVKVALTAEDVRDNDLPSDLEAKISSPNYQAFVRKYGTHVAELDAAPVEFLQSNVRKAIESVIDIDEFNRQVEQEKQDEAAIAAQRKIVLEAIAGGDA